MAQRRITDDLDQLFEVLPQEIRERLKQEKDTDSLIEIVLDLGRLPEARFTDRYVYLSDDPVTREDIQFLVQRVGRFGSDNRAGLERTLHRISAIKSRSGEIIGLTCRIGRAVFGTIDIIRDVVEEGRSILLLGRPGVGKTTMLRELARVLADEFAKRVVIVDTSNEIAGDGDVPHPAIGRARRMQVPSPNKQADVMIEAVENHMPEVIVVDEIGTQAEAEAARTIAERGVQLIGTAHGRTLENIVMNPTLVDLVGGIQAVTLGDEEARKRGTQKTVLERKAPPTFDVIVEIREKDVVAIHKSVASAVDTMLRGGVPRPEVRVRGADDSIQVIETGDAGEDGADDDTVAGGRGNPGNGGGGPASRPSGRELPAVIGVYPYAVSRNKVEQVINEMQAPVYVSRHLTAADIILTLKGQYRKMPKKLKEAEARGVPIYVIKSNTIAQIQGFMRSLVDGELAEV